MAMLPRLAVNLHYSFRYNGSEALCTSRFCQEYGEGAPRGQSAQNWSRGTEIRHYGTQGPFQHGYFTSIVSSQRDLSLNLVHFRI